MTPRWLVDGGRFARSAGVEAIAHTMSVSSDTLEDEVEPFLLRSEYVIRTQRGRCATAKAYEMLKLFNPNKDAGNQKPLF